MIWGVARDFLVEYSMMVQPVLIGALIWGLGTWVGRGRAHNRDGWTYAYFGWPMKLIAVSIVAGLTTALLRNGKALSEESWLVVAVVVVATVGFWWMFYEVFITRLRWNDEGLELRRPPFPHKYIPLDQLERITPHPITESISFISADGTRIWLSDTYRTGMADLHARLDAEIYKRQAIGDSE